MLYIKEPIISTVEGFLEVLTFSFLLFIKWICTRIKAQIGNRLTHFTQRSGGRYDFCYQVILLPQDYFQSFLFWICAS